MALPRQTSLRELIRKFKNLGWSGPHSGGNHRMMRLGTRTIRIPNPHGQEVGIRLLTLILKQAEISDDDWNNA